MREGVVVDTSVFVEYLRGSADDTLAVLILDNRVLLSPIVRLELFAGVKRSDFKVLEKLCDSLQNIDSFASVKECEKLLLRAKGSGFLGGIPDFLIMLDAIRHKAPLLTYDVSMKQLAKKLGVKVVEA